MIPPRTWFPRSSSPAVAILSTLLCLALPARAEGGQVDSWRSREGVEGGLVAQPALHFQPEGSADALPLLRVDPAQTFQTLTGLGNSFEHSTCYNLSRLSPPRRREVLERLLDPDQGIGMSLVRICIGTPDFTASPWYTYDDLAPGETDPSLRRFSIGKDREYVLPVLKEALRVQPDLKFFASPWSPPAWMKTNDRIGGGAIDPRHFAAFAEYLARFVEAYRREGIPIHALTLQNEPEYAPETYPSCLWTAAQQRDFIRDHLGPLFRRRGISTRIWGFDHNFEHPEFPTTILSDVQAAQYVDGTGFHHYVGTADAMTRVHDRFPDKAIHFTEGSTFGVAGAGQIVSYLRNWAGSYTAWVSMIDQNRQPNPGPHPCSLTGVVFNNVTREPEYRFDYHMYGHFMKFLRPGAQRIGSPQSADLPSNVAFRNRDGTVVLVAVNPEKQDRRFRIAWEGQHLDTRLPPRSLATFRWMP